MTNFKLDRNQAQ